MIRKRKPIVIWGMIILMLWTWATPHPSVHASAIEDDFIWTPAGGGTAMITDYIGTNKAVQIPPQLDGLTVTMIGAEAFRNKQLVAVDIPDTVERIEWQAFADNELVHLELPNSIQYMANGVFANNKLETVKLPDHLTSIPSTLFENNLLTQITLPENIAYIGEYAFSGNALTSLVLPDSLTMLMSGAFRNNELTSLTLPSVLPHIPDDAFAENKLTHVTIPSNTSTIGLGAFWGNQLTELTIPNQVREIGAGAFAQNKLTKVVIPHNVQEIYDAAFFDNELETVVIMNDQVNFAAAIFPDPNIVFPPAFFANQTDPTQLTFIAPAGSTAETYAELHQFSFIDLATAPTMVEEVEAELMTSKVEVNRIFYVLLKAAEWIPISGPVQHHVQIISDREGLILDEQVQFVSHGSDQSRHTFNLKLTERGHHQLFISIDGVAADPLIVDVHMNENTMNRFKDLIDEANEMLQGVTIGTELGQYADREAVNDFAVAVSVAEAVYENLQATEAEISAAIVTLGRAMITFEYFQVTVADIDPMATHFFVADGERFVLPDQLATVTYIVYKHEKYGTITYNGRADASVMWFSDLALTERVVDIDLGQPGVYELIGQVDYYDDFVEYTIIVHEGEVPIPVVVGNQAMLEFNTGTLISGLPDGATVHGADISHNVPNEYDLIPAGGVMKFTITGAAGPLNLDIFIPIDLSVADPGEVGIVYFNEAEGYWEYVFGSEVVDIEGTLYAKATITHNSVYGVAIINAWLLVNGMHIDNPLANETQLRLPELPDGFIAEVVWSSDEDVIDLDGKITPPDEPTVVELYIFVENEYDDYDAYGMDILIHVPAKVSAPSVAPNAVNQTYLLGSEGGTFTLNDVTLTFPTDAIDGALIVSVQSVADTSRLPLPDDAIFVSAVYEVTKNREGRFNKLITIALPFDSALIDWEDYDIAVYWLDEATNEWIMLDHIEVDREHGVVSGQIDHFTKFAVLATDKLAEATTEQPSDPGTVQLSDIAGHWAEEAIVSLVGRGAINGYPDGTFKPNQQMTRAEFATVLVKAFELTAEDGIYFADTVNHWAGEAIATAAAHGVITGYDETYFGPDDFISREQMAVMIARIAQLNAQAASLPYEDADAISKWARDAVSQTTAAEIMNGYPDGTFQPQSPATRAEAVTVIVKALNDQ